jgi:FMN-dependent NADH-azoreductase
MTTLLHVSASPRGAASESLALASAFLDTYREVNPDVMVETLDLWQAALPVFGPVGASAKMVAFGGGTPEGELAVVWAQAQRLADQFTVGDLDGSAFRMWNAGALRLQAVDRYHHPAPHALRLRPGHRLSGLVQGKRQRRSTPAQYAPGVLIEYGTIRQLRQRLAAVRRRHRRHRNPLPAHL